MLHLLIIIGVIFIAILSVSSYRHRESNRYRIGVILLDGGIVINLLVVTFYDRLKSVVPEAVLLAVLAGAFVAITVGGYAYYTAVRNRT